MLLPAGRVDEGHTGRERRGDEGHQRERGPDSGQFGDAAEHRPDDEAGDGDAEHRAERLPAPLARDTHGHPCQRSCPRGGAREALGEPRDPERDRTAGEREAARLAAARAGESRRRLLASGRYVRREQPARDLAEERTAPVGTKEEPGLELRQVVVVGEGGEERDDRPEEHRVDHTIDPVTGDPRGPRAEEYAPARPDPELQVSD